MEGSFVQSVYNSASMSNYVEFPRPKKGFLPGSLASRISINEEKGEEMLNKD